MFVIKKFKAIKNVYKILVSFVLYCAKANRNTMDVIDLSFFGNCKTKKLKGQAILYNNLKSWLVLVWCEGLTWSLYFVYTIIGVFDYILCSLMVKKTLWLYACCISWFCYLLQLNQGYLEFIVNKNVLITTYHILNILNKKDKDI